MHKVRYLYSELSRRVAARKGCNEDWFERHTDIINKLVKQLLPSGAGFASGTTINLEKSHADKLVFETSFHHMNEAGYYDGWTKHTVTVTPNLYNNFHLRISGRNRNAIKNDIHEMFNVALRSDVTYWLYLDRYPKFQVEHKWEDPQTGQPSQCFQTYYVGEERFADRDEAYSRAADLMEAAFYSK
jgi:hypothetical protein